MNKIFRKYGRYFLLDQIGQGGMADIFRARMASVSGPNRLVVIKQINLNFKNREDFNKMFKAEIEVTSGFNHPNIVSVYDFGEIEGTPYIAMEYIEGRDVYNLHSLVRNRGGRFPIAASVYIVEQVARSLAYAHNFSDKLTGEIRNIIHRDISPQNILVSFDGIVKVIDFGVAKVTSDPERTQGSIKGKPSYLSPEQVACEILDGRSDVFTLGVVLWELLTGRKLFVAENLIQLLKTIVSSEFVIEKPSTYNPEVPEFLDQVVLKALERKREDRFPSAELFQEALLECLHKIAPKFTSGELGSYVTKQFSEERTDELTNLKRLNEEAEEYLRRQNIESIESLPTNRNIRDLEATELTPEPLLTQDPLQEINLRLAGETSASTVPPTVKKPRPIMTRPPNTIWDKLLSPHLGGGLLGLLILFLLVGTPSGKQLISRWKIFPAQKDKASLSLSAYPNNEDHYVETAYGSFVEQADSPMPMTPFTILNRPQVKVYLSNQPDRRISLPTSQMFENVNINSRLILQWEFISDAVAYSVWKINPISKERMQVAYGLFSSFEIKITPEDLQIKSIQIELVAHAKDGRRDRGTGVLELQFQREISKTLPGIVEPHGQK